MLLNVVLGGSTRLSRALIDNCLDPQDGLLIAARHPDEAEVLSRRYPNARVFAISAPSPVADLKPTNVKIYCCALGMVHPENIQLEQDIRHALRDFQALTQLVCLLHDTPLHIIMVSSVLAMRPRPSREYYSGWKSVATAVTTKLVEGLDRANASIVLPGRLTESRSARRPETWLYSRYIDLARTMRKVSDTPSSVRRVVGVDARLWLCLQAAVLVQKALTGRG